MLLKSSFHILYMLITWMSYGIALKKVDLFYAAFYYMHFLLLVFCDNV